MNMADLQRQLAEHGVTVTRLGDKLRLRAQVRPPAELLELVKQAKGELLGLLPDEANAGRSAVDFRLESHPSGSWATCIATGSPEAIEQALRARYGQRLVAVRHRRRGAGDPGRVNPI